MEWYPRGSLVFADDPTGAHTTPRPVVAISNEERPYVDEECTVVCLGTDADVRYRHHTPVLPDRTVGGVRRKKKSHVLPWALYTVYVNVIDDSLPRGTVTDEGMAIVADAIDATIRP